MPRMRVFKTLCEGVQNFVSRTPGMKFMTMTVTAGDAWSSRITRERTDGDDF